MSTTRSSKATTAALQRNKSFSRAFIFSPFLHHQQIPRSLARTEADGTQDASVASLPKGVAAR